MKILITGGHLSPALGVIDEIDNKSDIVFVGKKYSLDSEKTYSLEFQEIEKKGIKFYNLTAGRFTRLLTIKSLINLFKIPVGFRQSFRILKTEKPDIILSFGGYIGFPISVMGFILNIPVFIHEQTANPGAANRIAGLFAKKIFIAFEEAFKVFPRRKTILTGNPVRKMLLKPDRKPFEIKKNLPVIYFTGGSLGSHSINLLLEKILPDLLKKYIVIHQIGNIKEYNDFEKFLEIRKRINKESADNYFPREHFFESEMGFVYNISDLVIGRSGANTFFELIAWEKPAIFIPLPWSANQEQLKHAQVFKDSGVGEIFNQSGKSEELKKMIDQIILNIKIYKNNFKNLEKLYKKDAAKVIVKTVKSNLKQD